MGAGAESLLVSMQCLGSPVDRNTRTILDSQMHLRNRIKGTSYDPHAVKGGLINAGTSRQWANTRCTP